MVTTSHLTESANEERILNMSSGAKKPFINLVAGPNGSGKTTFAESFLIRTQEKSIYLNPDLIASGISPLEFEKASFQAGRVLITEVKGRIKTHQNVSFESTLSGRTWFPILSHAKQKGYSITIYFLMLKKIEMSLKRIQKRVEQGGHNIPKEAVYRRHSRVFNNFWNLYRPLADEWHIFDNSASSPKRLIGKKEFVHFSNSKKEEFEAGFLNGKVL